MNKIELLSFNFESNNEKALKAKLNQFYNENGFSQTVYLLAIKNQLLLNSCDIDDNLFNKILLKNYIYFLNSANKLNFDSLSYNTKQLIDSFNSLIEKNEFDKAYNIYSNNDTIYNLLCGIYVKGSHKTEAYKISKIDDKNIETVYEKLSLLENANLNFEKEKVKIYQKTSNR